MMYPLDTRYELGQNETMKPTKCIVMPVGGPATVTSFDGYEGLRELVGGWIEHISGYSVSEWGAYLDEEGKLKDLPINVQASAFAESNGWVFLPGDVLCGPVVFVGPPDSQGDDTDVPDFMLKMIEGA